MKKYLVIILILFLNCQLENQNKSQSGINNENLEFKLEYKFSDEIQTEFVEKNKRQSAAWEYSYIGEYKTTLKIWDGTISPRSKISSKDLKHFHFKYRKKDAVKYIARQSADEQIVILNEAHHQPLHRVFATELLKVLYEKGFRFFGVETLSRLDKKLNERKYPIYNSGYYTKEPQFGELIRAAIDLGFEVFPYEAMNASGYEREIAQAKNIQRKLRANPDGKLLIYCGFAHAVEGPYKSWEKAMAGRIRELTQINPLTINQVEYTEKSDISFSHPLLQELDLSTSSVFVNKENESYKLQSNPEWFDIMVFHPFTKYRKGRPTWLLRNDKMFVKFEIKPGKVELPILVLAFEEMENYNTAIPSDIIEIKNLDEDYYLALKKENYNLIIVDKLRNIKIEKLKMR